MTTYTHLELECDIAAPAGYYTPLKEVRLELDGREVLYIVRRVVVDSSCCGGEDFASALVPGYVVKWRSSSDHSGLPVSEVEPARDETVRDRVRQAIRENEGIDRTEFW